MGGFHRINYDGQAAVLAQSEDYAFLIKALLDLHQASLGVITETSAQDWLAAALKVQREFDDYLWALEGGGYYNTANDAADDLLIRERSWLDNATPAANGVAIANLIRLALLTEQLDYLDRAEQALKTFGQILQHSPQACPSLFMAVDWFHHHTLIRANQDSLRTLIPDPYLPTAAYALASDLPPGTMEWSAKDLPAKHRPTRLNNCNNKLVRVRLGVKVLIGERLRCHWFLSVSRNRISLL